SATEVPKIEVTFAEFPSPLNPLGVKGVGESGCVPAAGAIVSAIENALAPFGVRISEYPVTPARLYALLAHRPRRRPGRIWDDARRPGASPDQVAMRLFRHARLAQSLVDACSQLPVRRAGEREGNGRKRAECRYPRSRTSFQVGGERRARLPGATEERV